MSDRSLTALPPTHPRSGRTLVLIETPEGSRCKYKYDSDLRMLCISRVLPEGLVFPHAFGSIPGTRTQDGDALDALVVGVPTAFPGCLVTTRLLGIIRSRQTESRRGLRNDRIIACVETDATPAQFQTLNELGRHRLEAIEQFFANYNRAEGRPFRITGRGPAKDAHAALVRSTREFQTFRGA